MVVELVKKQDVKDLGPELLEFYMSQSLIAINTLNELVELEEWERSIKYNEIPELAIIYDNQDTLRTNHEIFTLVRLENEFGEIIYN